MGSEEDVNNLIKTLKNSKNDTERCAAMFAVSKLVKANELNQQQKIDLCHAIGFSFPIRLLMGNIDCNKSVLVGLGFSLLSILACNSELCHSLENKKVIPIVLDLLNNDNQETVSCLDKTSISDCFQYLALLATTDIGCQAILGHDGISILAKTCKTFSNLHLFCNVLQHLTVFDSELIWKDNKQHMLNFLETLCTQASADFSKIKFKFYCDLTSFIKLLPNIYIHYYSNHKWVKTLGQSIYEVFKCKITVAERNPTLILCQQLIDTFGLQWTTLIMTEGSASTFIIFLSKLVCIEMQMKIYEWIDHKNAASNIHDCPDLTIYLSCCAMFEAICSAIAEFDINESSDELFTVTDINSLKVSLADTINVITRTLLPHILNLKEFVDLVVSSARTVGSWLNVQLFATSKLGLDLVETVFIMFKIGLEKEPSSVIKSLTPAFLYYAEEASTRKFLLKKNLFNCFRDIIIGKALDSETKSLSCQCFMAFCLGSEKIDKMNTSLPVLMDYSSEQDDNITLHFYVATLALMLWNKNVESVNKLECNGDRFFSKLLNFLSGMHSCSGHQLIVAKQYSSIWHEVEQLWPILIKELIRAARNSKSVYNSVLKSKFPGKVKTLLSCEPVEDEVSDCYYLFSIILDLK